MSVRSEGATPGLVANWDRLARLVVPAAAVDTQVPVWMEQRKKRERVDGLRGVQLGGGNTRTRGQPIHPCVFAYMWAVKMDLSPVA